MKRFTRNIPNIIWNLMRNKPELCCLLGGRGSVIGIPISSEILGWSGVVRLRDLFDTFPLVCYTSQVFSNFYFRKVWGQYAPLFPCQCNTGFVWDGLLACQHATLPQNLNLLKRLFHKKLLALPRLLTPPYGHLTFTFCQYLVICDLFENPATWLDFLYK